jgi:hypothetical protein
MSSSILQQRPLGDLSFPCEVSTFETMGASSELIETCCLYGAVSLVISRNSLPMEHDRFFRIRVGRLYYLFLVSKCVQLSSYYCTSDHEMKAIYTSTGDLSGNL